MRQKYFLSDIQSLKIAIDKPSLVFLRWDLWAGKTTLAKHILGNLVWVTQEVRSPTYTYVNKYAENAHFDLYRMKDYDEFFAIGWEDILDNNQGVILVEWPEKIEKYYKPDIDITLRSTENEGEREIEVVYRGEK